MKSPDNLLYLDNRFHPRDVLDTILEAFLRWPLRIKTAGTESNIPQEGRVVFGFMPHGGIIESVVVDASVRRVRKKPVVWMTKEENEEDLPGLLSSFRLLAFLNRKFPQHSVVKALLQVLANGGVMGSAFEGTRSGNPQDPNDLRYLAEAHPGLVRFAYDAKAPIVVVVILGSENFLPRLKEEKEKRGTMGIVLEIIRRGLTDKTEIRVRFLPPYRGHIDEDRGIITKSEWSKIHTDRIVREIIIPKIQSLDPSYPLGFYAEQVRR